MSRLPKEAYLACETGNRQLLERILYEHLDITNSIFRDVETQLDMMDEHGKTLLMISIENNHIDITRCLLEYGALPYKAGFGGVTPLDFAMEMGNIDCIRLIRSGIEKIYVYKSTFADIHSMDKNNFNEPENKRLCFGS